MQQVLPLAVVLRAGRNAGLCAQFPRPAQQAGDIGTGHAFMSQHAEHLPEHEVVAIAQSPGLVGAAAPVIQPGAGQCRQLCGQLGTAPGHARVAPIELSQRKADARQRQPQRVVALPGRMLAGQLVQPLLAQAAAVAQEVRHLGIAPLGQALCQFGGKGRHALAPGRRGRVQFVQSLQGKRCCLVVAHGLWSLR